MMHDQVFRRNNEPLEKYRNRLVDLSKDILRRRNDAYGNLQSGSINPKSQFSNEFFEDLKNDPNAMVKVKTPEGIKVMTVAQAKALGAK
jgi:hypothetical protein